MLTTVLSCWASRQRVQEKQNPNLITHLGDPLGLHLVYSGAKPTGSLLPPASKLKPDVMASKYPPDLDKYATQLSDISESARTTIQSCLDMLALGSRTAWSAQNSSPARQHHKGLAITLLRMHLHKSTHLQYFLGEDCIWSFYTEYLENIQKLSPSYCSWHNTTIESRLRNSQQHIVQKTMGEESLELAPAIGVVLAQSTTAIHDKYRVNIRKVISAVEEMAGIPVNGECYLSADVSEQLQALISVSSSNS